MNDLPDSPPDAVPSGTPVVGARLIVDVLRHFAGTPPETVQLTPMRNKAAQFVLEKSLQKMEAQAAMLTFPVPQMALASTLYQFARNEKKILYMSTADWGAVKLIDVAFDAVIDQGKLDAEAIWLLNRFRLPLYHSILSDYSFFFTRQNLARRFLNAVTLHLLTTREPFSRELKFVLGGIATRMHEAFDQGPGKFNALCLEGQTWFATQQQRLHKAETKVRELAETRSRRRQAEERVVLLLNRCISNKTLPVLLVEFITGDWRKLLLFTSMKEGEQGINWKRQSRLTESMVEFVGACETTEGREQYQKFLPSLVKGLRAALADIIDGAQRISIAMEPVELALNALLAGARPETMVHPGLALPQPAASEFEITVESSPALERVLALTPGQWVRFKTQDRQYEACTLAFKGQGSEPWSFVNQSGQGVVNKTVTQLAALLTSGVLEIVGEGNAFDEVLNHAIAKAAAHIPRSAVGASSSERPAPIQAEDKRERSENKCEVSETGQAPPPIDSIEVSPPVEAPVIAAAEPPREAGVEQQQLAALTANLQQQEITPEDDLPAEFPAAVMEASYAAVDGLQIGARLIWYKSDEEDVTLKLAVKLRSSDKLVFVNHIGIKTLDTHREALARLIASGRVVIIDIGAKFDSALERIVKHIQQDKK